MASIQTGIELQDNFTSVIMGIINSVNLAVSAMENLDQQMAGDIDTSAIQSARNEINGATIAANQLSRAFQDMAVPAAPAAPQPVQWQSDSLTPVIDVSGMERYQQEIQRTGQMLSRLDTAQARISQAAASMDILPDTAVQDITSLGTRLDGIRERIQQIGNNPVTMGTDAANAQLEQLRSQLHHALQEQEGLNSAMDSMDISEINNAYMRLSQTISGTERYLRDNASSAAPPPVQWQSDSLTPVIDVSGMERYQQEIQRTGQMLSGLNAVQAHISQAAASMDILPDTAVQDITSLGTRLNSIRERIQQIENNPVTMGTDAANAQLEQLRAQLHRALQEQEGLNRAMDSMDISDINSAYMRLSQTISGTERYLRDNTDTQENFNRSVDRCRSLADHAAAGFKGWEKAIILANNALGLVKNTIGNLGITDVSGAFDRIDTMNRFQRTITTMTGDAGMADAALAKLKDTTVGTAYGLDVASKAAQGFTTRGMGLGAATEQVRIWADAVSFYGKGTNEQFENVVDAVGKIYSKGTVEAMQMDRLFDAGIDAAGIYAKAVGKSVGEVKDALTNREISSVDFIDTVTKALDTGVSSGAAKEAGDLWATTFANVKAAATRGWTGVIQSIDDQLAAHGLPSSMELVQSFGQTVENVLGSVADSMGVIIGWGVRIGEAISSIGTFISDNWGIIEPVLYGVVAALIAFAVIMGVIKAVTTIAAAAQFLFRAALLATPLTWIIIIIVALIGVVVALANHFSGAGHVAQSVFGAICGGINVVIHFFKNLFFVVVDIALGIWEALKAVVKNIPTLFYNAICDVQSFFYGLLSSALEVVEGICEALNRLPFVDFDYSGISQAADDYAAKSAEAAGNKRDYVSIKDAFYKGAETFEVFSPDWVKDAYKAGAEWGDGISDKVKGFFTIEDPYKGKDKDKEPEIDPNALADSMSLTANNTDDTAKNTAKTADSLSATSEDLKYLRDIAGRDYVNKFTTAEIKVNMTNHNTVNNEMDLDGISKKLREDFEGEIYTMAEGVH